MSLETKRRPIKVGKKAGDLKKVHRTEERGHWSWEKGGKSVRRRKRFEVGKN